MAARNLTLAFASPSTAVPVKPTEGTISPMTELANSFKTHTSINTPKRKLSLSDTDSPFAYKDFGISPDCDSGSFNSPCAFSPTLDMLNSRNRARRQSAGARPAMTSLHDRLMKAHLQQSDSPSLDKENLPSILNNPQLKHNDKQPLFSHSQNHEFVKPTGPAPCVKRVASLRQSQSLSCASPKLSSFLGQNIHYSQDTNTGEVTSPLKRFIGQTQDDDDDEDDFDDDSSSSSSSSSEDEDVEDDGDGFDVFSQETELEGEEQCVSSELAGLLKAPLQDASNTFKDKLSPEEGMGTIHVDKGNTPKVPREESVMQPCGLFDGSSESGRPRVNRSASLSLKRAKPSSGPSPVERKRLRGRCQSAIDSDWKSPIIPSSELKNPTPKLMRSASAIAPPTVNLPLRSVDGVEMVGDGSKPCALPTISGQHQDLKSITPETLSRLLDGEYESEIGQYFVIDCRFPYEFQGGHIRTAMNLYKKEEVYDQFLKTPIPETAKRTIIIFHCEFSSKRGPRLCRFLRNKDRDFHRDCYPKLFYPELYLLEGGYKEFFEKQKEYCEPQTYLPMVDKNHQHELKLFKTRSKSWHEGQFRKAMRPGLNYKTKHNS